MITLGPLVSELKRPGTAIAVALALAGAALSLYLYYKGIKSGELYYQISQVQAFDQRSMGPIGSDASEPIRVVDQKGEPIRSNIYAANIDVWNGGSDEIRKSDVRSPFRLILSGNTSFYNLVMFGQTNNNRDAFKLVDKNTIDWEHFDPGEGFRLRLLYASDDKQKLAIEGYSLNVSTVADVEARDKRLKSYVIVPFFLIFVSTILIVFVVTIFKRRTDHNGNKLGYFTSLGELFFETPIILVLGLCLIVTAFIPELLIFILKVPKPPFG